MDRAGKDHANRMAAILLALFPVLFIFDTRLGAIALVAAVVLLYRGSVNKRVKQVGRENTPPQSAWKDPWDTGSSDANRA